MRDSKKRKAIAEVILLLLSAHFALGSLLLEKNMIARVFQVIAAIVTSMLWWHTANGCGRNRQFGFLLFGSFVLLVCHLPSAMLRLLSWQVYATVSYVRYFLFFLPVELLQSGVFQFSLPAVVFIDIFVMGSFVVFFMGTIRATKEHRHDTQKII